MSKPWLDIHPYFRLNGTGHNSETLTDAAKILLNRGEDYEKSIGSFLLQWLDDSSHVVVNTSGSTGTPKKITLQKLYMVNSAHATADFFLLREGMTALLCLSCDFIAGKMMLVRAMVLGLDLRCVIPSSNPLGHTEESFDFCAMVPLQVNNSLTALNRIKTLIVGGASVPFQLAKKIQMTSCNGFETYGMTETITHIAARPIGENKRTFNVLPDIQVSTDTRDCLVINAPKLGVENLVTNDLVRVRSSSSFEWLGRFDNIINSGGVKLVPETIETKLAPIFENRFFVAGLRDEVLGERLVLVVEGTSDPGLREKLASVKDLLRYEVPKEVHSLPSFVETESGKVNRSKTLALL